MLKSRYKPPYKKDGHTAFHKAYKRNGVYMIKSKKTGKVVYVGESHTGRLYRTLYRHFEQWKGRKQYDRNRYTVRVLICSPKQADKYEKLFIDHYKPKDNAVQYEVKFDKDIAMKTFGGIATSNFDDVPF